MDASGIINAVQNADESLLVEDTEMQRWRMMCGGTEFWDDVKQLNWELAVQARKLEMELFKETACSRKYFETLLRRWVARSSPQNWVDTKKGDSSRPNCRSRLVGREVKYDKRLDLFSETPPLETLKLLCSMCARGETGPEPYRFAVIDIERAYIYALVRRPIFIEIPTIIGNLDTRDAWTSCSSACMVHVPQLRIGRSSTRLSC